MEIHFSWHLWFSSHLRNALPGIRVIFFVDSRVNYPLLIIPVYMILAMSWVQSLLQLQRQTLLWLFFSISRLSGMMRSGNRLCAHLSSLVQSLGCIGPRRRGLPIL